MIIPLHSARRLRTFVALLSLCLAATAQEAYASSPVGLPESNWDLRQDIRSAVKYFALDGWHVTTAPTRINKKTGLIWAGFLVTTGVVYAYDEEILDAFERNEGGDLYEFILKPGRKIEPVGHMGNTMRYYFGALGVSYIIRNESLTRFFAELIESHGIAGFYRNFTKTIVGRHRPFEDKGPYFYEFNTGTSFPSGHASNIFQVATVLSHHVDYLPVTIVAYYLATSVALQRLESESHWPSDVLVGVVFGTAVARTVVRLNEERRVRVAPVLAPENGTVGLQFSFRF